MQYNEEAGQLEGDDACRRSGFAGDQPGRVLSQKQGKDESRECLCHSSRDCSLNTKMDSREKLEEGKKVGGGRSPSGSWLQQQPAAARRTEDSMAFPIVLFFFSSCRDSSWRRCHSRPACRKEGWLWWWLRAYMESSQMVSGVLGGCAGDQTGFQTQCLPKRNKVWTAARTQDRPK